MAQIIIETSKPGIYIVTVNASRITTHRVELKPAYHKKLSGKSETAEALIRRSFEFLMSKEPNTRIMSSFDLPTIQKQFSDFEKTIKK